MGRQFDASARPTDMATLARRMKALEDEVALLRSTARQLEAATIGKGGLAVQAPGDLRIIDDAGNVIWSATDGPARFASTQRETSGITFGTGWSSDPYAEGPLSIPPGFHSALFQIYASAGATADVGGVGANVGVEPVLIDATSGEVYGGPAISNGVAAGLGGSAVSTWNITLGPFDSDAGWPLRVGAQAYANNDVTSGTCNVHVSAFAVFLR